MKIIPIIMLFIAMTGLGCISEKESTDEKIYLCQADSDCTFAHGCCDSVPVCVNKEFKSVFESNLDCNGVICPMMEYRGTYECKCIEKKCTSEIKS